MSARARAWRTIVVLLCMTCASRFAAAQGVGAIGGTIADASGGVLPGVTVTLANPGTIGGNQSAVSDERGAYQFTGSCRDDIPSGPSCKASDRWRRRTSSSTPT